MSDQQIREAERAWQEFPSPETQRRYLAELGRAEPVYLPRPVNGRRAEDRHDLRPGDLVWCRRFNGAPPRPARVLRRSRIFSLVRGHARKHLVLVDAENGVTQFTEWAGSLDRDPNATLAERALAIVKNALEGRPYWFIRRTQGIVEAIVVRAPPVEGGAHGDRVESLVQGFSP